MNRLDRLTSGLMIIATSPARARVLCDEFLNKTIKKEYIARCVGRFPELVLHRCLVALANMLTRAC